MKMEPLISIVVPVYNVEKYLRTCIQSIINQTYHNLEIILVDDGSTDKSGQICDEYSLHDARINVIHKANGGLSDARNVAIDCAKGELLTFVDGDDFLTRTAIDSMYKASIMSGAQIVCCLFKFAYEGKHTDFNETYDESKLSVYECADALKKMLHQSEVLASAWAKLYKAELFNGIRYPKGELYEDLGTTYKLFCAADKTALIRIDGYGYFVRSGSIQQSKFAKSKMAELRFAKEQKEYIDARFPKLELATTDRLVSSCFHILFAIMEQQGFESERKEVEKIIKGNRKRLLLSKDTSKKTRYGCLLSYLGFRTEAIIYKKLGVRGKMIS